MLIGSELFLMAIIFLLKREGDSSGLMGFVILIPIFILFFIWVISSFFTSKILPDDKIRIAIKFSLALLVLQICLFYYSKIQPSPLMFIPGFIFIFTAGILFLIGFLSWLWKNISGFFDDDF